MKRPEPLGFILRDSDIRASATTIEGTKFTTDGDIQSLSRSSSNGYSCATDMSRVELERIQFVGALLRTLVVSPSHTAFLPHAPLIMADYPGEVSPLQIYGTYARGLLKVIPNLKAFSGPYRSYAWSRFRYCSQPLSELLLRRLYLPPS